MRSQHKWTRCTQVLSRGLRQRQLASGSDGTVNALSQLRVLPIACSCLRARQLMSLLPVTNSRCLCAQVFSDWQSLSDRAVAVITQCRSAGGVLRVTAALSAQMSREGFVNEAGMAASATPGLRSARVDRTTPTKRVYIGWRTDQVSVRRPGVVCRSVRYNSGRRLRSRSLRRLRARPGRCRCPAAAMADEVRELASGVTCP